MKHGHVNFVHTLVFTQIGPIKGITFITADFFFVINFAYNVINFAYNLPVFLSVFVFSFQNLFLHRFILIINKVFFPFFSPAFVMFRFEKAWLN